MSKNLYSVYASGLYDTGNLPNTVGKFYQLSVGVFASEEDARTAIEKEIGATKPSYSGEIDTVILKIEKSKDIELWFNSTNTKDT